MRAAVATLVLVCSGVIGVVTLTASCGRSPDGAPVGGGPPPTSAAHDPGIDLYERRTAGDPRDHLSPATLASLYLRRGEELRDATAFEPAEKAARTSLARKPDHAAAKVLLARALAGQGKLPEAGVLLRNVLSDAPRDVRALEASFDLAIARGDEPSAVAMSDRLLAINEEPGTLSRLAQMAARRGDVNRAVTLFRRASDEAADLGGLPGEIAEYRRRAGLALLAAGRAGEASVELEAALATNPSDADAVAARAKIRSGGER
ncbi:MAG: hypothetical protein K8T90_16400 [Planctomycetes bacterium]|nr:hypothetical protein [Planctomycetota bacterium]